MTVEEPGVIGLYGGPKVILARPAVDSLFFSAAKMYGRRVIGVVSTGNGEDGATGLSAITDGGQFLMSLDTQTGQFDQR